MITVDDYKNPYGTWMVTTEGDCEGRSTRNLGVYVGYIDEIAFALAEKCYYSLKFEKVCTDVPIPTKALNKVNITLDISSKTWELSNHDRVVFFRNMLQNRDVYVSEGSSYASVILSKVNLEKTKRDIALAKLTSEEKSLLGLE